MAHRAAITTTNCPAVLGAVKPLRFAPSAHAAAGLTGPRLRRISGDYVMAIGPTAELLSLRGTDTTTRREQPRYDPISSEAPSTDSTRNTDGARRTIAATSRCASSYAFVLARPHAKGSSGKLPHAERRHTR